MSIRRFSEAGDLIRDNDRKENKRNTHLHTHPSEWQNIQLIHRDQSIA